MRQAPAAALAALVFGLALAATAPAGAQQSPYVEHREREIKALSAEEVDGLLAGQGMGLALAAELNGYPGPKHVLELAEELELTADQREAVERVHAEMAQEAVELGEQVVAAERRLDALFAGGEASADALESILGELGRLQASLRYAHLNAHLETKPLLTEAQVRHYTQLRGYAANGMDHHQHHPGRR